MSLPLSTTGTFKRTTGIFKAMGAAKPPALTEVDNPFPGLRPFREDEEHLFFGRESQVDRMVDKMGATRFLAVVGTSGTGKSSLVNCGLKPALHRGLMAKAGTSWAMVQFRPGGNPIHSMAQAFAGPEGFLANLPTGGLSTLQIAETTLRMSSLGLVDLFQFANLPAGTNLLVVVDQFEELFRYAKANANPSGGETESGDAIAFVNLLLEAHKHTEYPIYIALTMRSDFLGECSQFDGLPEAINESQYLVPRMTRDARRAAIGGPIGVAGADLSPVLLTRLVNDVGDNPDQLSILQHAINRTWAHWQDDRKAKGELSLEDYNAVGTMARALDEHANLAYNDLAKGRQQALCEKVFKALTDKGTDARGIRRPMPFAQLCEVTGGTAAELEPVLASFRRPDRSFLMPPEGEPLEADTVIDISHEILMRAWERLKIWSDEEARSARTYRRLAETAELYANGGEGLLRDPGLKNALEWQWKAVPNAAWASMYRGGFDEAIKFLQKSKQEMDVEHAEAEFTRRWKRFVPYMFGFVFVFFLLISPKLSDWMKPVVMPRVVRLLKIPKASQAQTVEAPAAAADALAKPKALAHLNAANPPGEVFRGFNQLEGEFEREQFRKRNIADTAINSFGYGLGAGLSVVMYALLWFGGKRVYRKYAYPEILARMSATVAVGPELRPGPALVMPLAMAAEPGGSRMVDARLVDRGPADRGPADRGPVPARSMGLKFNAIDELEAAQGPSPLAVRATVWRRLVAGVIDWIVFMVSGSIALFAVIAFGEVVKLPTLAENAGIFGAWLFFDFLYQMIAKQWLWRGTLGDLMCGLSLSGLSGGHPKTGQIVSRYLWRASPWLVGYVVGLGISTLPTADGQQWNALTGAVAVLVILWSLALVAPIPFNRRRQALYDMFAKTLVVRRPAKAKAPAYRVEAAGWG